MAFGSPADLGARASGAATFFRVATLFAVFATGSSGAFFATAVFSGSDFLPDGGGTTAFGAAGFFAVAFLTVTDAAAGLAARAFVVATRFAGPGTADTFSAAGLAGFAAADFFAVLCAVDAFFAGSAVRRPGPSPRLRGDRARRTSAATVSSRG